MNRDITLEKIPKGESPYILNGNPSEDYGTITNEKGTTLEVSITSGYNIIGTCLLDDNRQVLFCVNSTLGLSKIYIKNVATLTEVVPATALLNFSIEHQIESVFKRNYKGDYIVYWTDFYNKPRWFNITDPITLTTNNIKTIDLFSSYGRPLFNLNGTPTGGSILSGVYQFFVQYEDSYNNTTDFIGASNLVPVTPSTEDMKPFKYSGAAAGTPTSKKISLALSNIDITYSRINVVVVYYNNGIIETPKLFTSQPITSSSMTIEYTGNETFESVVLANVLSLFAKYNTAKSIISFDKTLYLANLTGGLDLGLQKYVNNISVDYELHATNLETNSTSFNNEVVIYNNRGFMQDDVYALYIAYVLTDGSITKAYHIPGRPSYNISKYRVSSPDFQENATVQSILSGSAYPGDRSLPDNVLQEAIDLNSNAKWFQFFGTEDNINSTNSNLGLWENQNETYPDSADWDVFSLDPAGTPIANGTLRNSLVRHHKMPEPEIKAGGSTKYLDNTHIGVRGNTIGLRVKNIPMPASVKDRIAGFKIYYAKKDQSNSLVLAQDVAKFRGVNNGSPSAWCSSGGNFRLTNSSGGAPTVNYVEIVDSIAFTLHDFNCLANDLDISSASWLKNIGGITQNALHVPSVDSTNFPGISDFTNRVNTGHSTNWLASTDATWKARDSEYIRRTKTVFYLNPVGINEYIGNSAIYGTTRDIHHNAESKSIFVEMYNEFSRTPFTFGNGTSVTSYQNYGILLNLMAYREDVNNSFDSQELVECYYDVAPGAGVYISNRSVQKGDTFLGFNSYRVAGTLEDVDMTGLSPLFINPRHEYVVPYLSRANASYRHQGTTNDEIYYPKSPLISGALFSTTGNGVLERPLTSDNYFGYNKDYSRGNDIIQPEIFQKNLTSDADKFLTRILRSNIQSEESIDDAFRQFPVNNYVDLDRDRGQIEVLKKDNVSIIVHLTNSITKTVANQILKTDTLNAYIGNGDIFSIPTREIRYSDIGYGGTQSQWAGVVTPYGYLYPDIKNRRVMLLGEGLDDISREGLLLYFNDNMSLKLLDQFPTINIPTDNPANPYSIGYSATWDNINRRYILSKRDYEMNSNYSSNVTVVSVYPVSPGFGTIVFYTPEKKFKIFNFPGTWTTLEWNALTPSGTRYFTDKSFSLGYYPELKSWFSFYSFNPLIYMYDQKNFWGILNNGIWKHNLGPRCNFYGTLYRFIIDVPFNDAGNKSKIFDSVQFISTYSLNNVEYVNKTFDKYNIYSSSGLSGETNIVSMDTARVVYSNWNIHSFRNLRSDYNTPILDGVDIVGTTNNSLANIYRSRFIDNFIILRLIHENADDAKLGLIFNSCKSRIKER